MSAVPGEGSLRRRPALDGHPLWQARGDRATARVIIGLAPPRAMLQVSAFLSDSPGDSSIDADNNGDTGGNTGGNTGGHGHNDGDTGGDSAAQRLSDVLGMPLPAPNRMTGDASINVRAIGPGIWHVIGDESRLVSVAQLRQRLDGVATVVDLGHARAVFHVSGPDAARTIAKHCGLDLDARIFPNGSATGTRFNHLGMTIARIDRADAASYELSVFRGYAVFVFESLVESAREFGVAIDCG